MSRTDAHTPWWVLMARVETADASRRAPRDQEWEFEPWTSAPAWAWQDAHRSTCWCVGCSNWWRISDHRSARHHDKQRLHTALKSWNGGTADSFDMLDKPRRRCEI